MQEFLQTDELDGLDDAGVADDQELGAGLVALLGQLDEGTETGGIDEVDAAQVDDQRGVAIGAVAADEVGELLVGVGIELACEPEQQALLPAFAASAQGDGQSLQIGDRSSPRSGTRGAV
jgi:hypothetical protein